MVQIDIQMPSDCYSCWIRKNMGCKIANDSGWLNNKRDDNCPLKEQEPVKPHYNAQTNWYECGACHHSITSGMHCRCELIPAYKAGFCAKCGKEVKWE